jgi:hypothetical protein
MRQIRQQGCNACILDYVSFALFTKEYGFSRSRADLTCDYRWTAMGISTG